MSIEGTTLKAIARAQGELLKATKALLKEDKHDGLRMARLCSLHEGVFHTIKSEIGDLCDEAELIEADRLAGEPL